MMCSVEYLVLPLRTRKFTTQFSSNKIKLKKVSQQGPETNYGKWVCCRSNTRSLIGWTKFHEKKKTVVVAISRNGAAGVLQELKKDKNRTTRRMLLFV